MDVPPVLLTPCFAQDQNYSREPAARPVVPAAGARVLWRVKGSGVDGGSDRLRPGGPNRARAINFGGYVSGLKF
jgi:hypothetical protein